MRWSAAALFALGLVAAVCAALLVQSIRDGRGPAAAEAPAAPITTEHPLGDVSHGPLGPREPETAGTTAEQAPSAAPSEAPVATELTGLPTGMRAVSVDRSAHTGLQELLHAGSVVDVLASIVPHTAPDALPDPVSLTLLEGVQVFAVGEAHGDVTLLVDPKQAERLVLAMEQGRISLVLRNASDETRQDAGGTSLSSLAPVLKAPPAGRQVMVTKGGVSELRTVRFDTQE